MGADRKTAEATKMKIYAAAAVLFEQKGIENTTIRDICAEANVSIGSFYHHFDGKDELLSIFSNKMDDMPKPIMRYLSSLDISYYNRLLLFLILQVQNLKQPKRLESAQRLMYLQLRNPQMRIFARSRAPYKSLLFLIQQCIEENSLHDVDDPKLLCDLLQSALRGLWFDWGLSDHEYDVCKRMLCYTRLILNRYICTDYEVPDDIIFDQAHQFVPERGRYDDIY